jgi:hypothetical protein
MLLPLLARQPVVVYSQLVLARQPVVVYSQLVVARQPVVAYSQPVLTGQQADCRYPLSKRFFETVLMKVPE